jgi:hypothetical protein
MYDFLPLIELESVRDLGTRNSWNYLPTDGVILPGVAPDGTTTP